MKIKEMPWFDRPWTRLRKEGVDKLSHAELLTVILGSGTKKSSSFEIANQVLSKYHFNHLEELSLSELTREFGDEILAMRIYAMFEMFRRTNRLKKGGHKQKIKTAKDVFDIFSDRLTINKKEEFYTLLLDTKNNVIGDHRISVGTLNASLIHPREVFNPAIKASANAIILVHNHPSGDCTPSKDDFNVTKNLVKSGEILRIKVLDHIVIGYKKYYSLKENNSF
jgi:DNA repair protein RadC